VGGIEGCEMKSMFLGADASVAQLVLRKLNCF
jgi:hypothetical protein